MRDIATVTEPNILENAMLTELMQQPSDLKPLYYQRFFELESEAN